MRQLLLILFLLNWSTLASAHGTGRGRTRYGPCQDDWCMMCARAHMLAGHGRRIPGWWQHSKYAQLHNSLHRTSTKPQLEPKPVDDEYLAPVPDFVSTPRCVVNGVLTLLRPGPTDVFCDLGCGDGRVLIAAARIYGCSCIGVDHNPHNVALARRNVKVAGVDDLVTVVEKDVREFDLRGVTVVWMYLDVDLIKELKPKLTSVRRVVSYCHPVPGVRSDKVVIDEAGPVYFWVNHSD